VRGDEREGIPERDRAPMLTRERERETHTLARTHTRKHTHTHTHRQEFWLQSSPVHKHHEQKTKAKANTEEAVVGRALEWWRYSGCALLCLLAV